MYVLPCNEFEIKGYINFKIDFNWMRLNYYYFIGNTVDYMLAPLTHSAQTYHFVMRYFLTNLRWINLRPFISLAVSLILTIIHWRPFWSLLARAFEKCNCVSTQNIFLKILSHYLGQGSRKCFSPQIWTFYTCFKILSSIGQKIFYC